MYYNLVSTLKRRLILELQDSFSRHPVYSKIVPFIQSKYSFQERPQMGIVLKGASANKVVLAGDNFIGMLQSYCMLAYVGEPVFPLEWIREDSGAIAANNNQPLSPPGIYYIEVLKAPADQGETGVYVIDPLLTQTAEPVLVVTTGVETEGQLQQEPVAGTLRLWLNGIELLREGTDYTLGTEGQLNFQRTFNPADRLMADYRYAGTTSQPIPWRWNTIDSTAIPGVVLAWGKRGKPGDKMAVVVTADRTDAAKVFGGKFEVSFDFDCIARDPAQLEEIGDLVVMYLLADKKPRLESEGIELLDVSLGGESEESYDENAGSFFYLASVAVQLRADWEVHEPLPLVISRVIPGVTQVNNAVYYQTEPYLLRPSQFERIG